MQSKSSSWWSALTAPAANWEYGLDILASDEMTPLEDASVYDLFASDRLIPKSSSVSLDTTASTHRKFQLQLRNSDGRYLPGPAGFASGGSGSPTAQGLVWMSARYRPWIALATSYSISKSGVPTANYDKTYLGIYVLSQPEVQVKAYGAITILTLLDKSALLAKPNLITNSTLPTYTASGGHSAGGFAAGTAFTSAMTTLATNGGISTRQQQIDPNALTLPADYPIKEGDDYWTHLQGLAASVGWVCYFDSLGHLRIRQDPLSVATASQYTFVPGSNSIMSQVDRVTDFQTTYNHVIVVGGSSKTGTFRGEAQINDPRNPYHKNEIGDRIVYVGKDGRLNDTTPDPNVGSTAQANTLAGVYLARHVGQQERVQITARNIPALEPYDRVTIHVDGAGLALDFMLTACTWQLGHDTGGGMQATFNRWFTVGS